MALPELNHSCQILFEIRSAACSFLARFSSAKSSSRRASGFAGSTLAEEVSVVCALAAAGNAAIEAMRNAKTLRMRGNLLPRIGTSN